MESTDTGETKDADTRKAGKRRKENADLDDFQISDINANKKDNSNFLSKKNLNSKNTNSESQSNDCEDMNHTIEKVKKSTLMNGHDMYDVLRSIKKNTDEDAPMEKVKSAKKHKKSSHKHAKIDGDSKPENKIETNDKTKSYIENKPDREIEPNLEKTQADQENSSSCDGLKQAQNNVSEVSYADFLQSLGSPKNEGELDSKTPTEENREDRIINKESSKTCVSVENTTDQDDMPALPKNYPSVTNFFSKVAKGFQRKKEDIKPNLEIKVTAVVHAEPTVVKENNSERTQKSPRSIKKISDDDEIEILGSEIISVDPVSKKSLFPETIILDTSTNDSLLSESSVHSVEISEDTTAVERKKSFLQSLSIPDVPTKTTQGTLNFFKTGESQKTHKFTNIKKSDKPLCKDEKNTDEKAAKKSAKGSKSGTISKIPKSQSTPRSKKDKQAKKVKLVDKNVEVEQTVEDDRLDMEVEELNQSGVAKRRSLRPRYKVALLDTSQDSGRNSPIRLKFKRFV